MKSRRNVSSPLLFAVATMVSAFILGAAAHADSRESALRAAEQARFEANVNADAKALGTLLDDDLEYTHSNGDLDSKSSFIASLTSGKRDYVATTFDIQSVRILGDVGIIRGTAKVTVADNGNSRDLDLGYTDIWVWKAGRWQMTAWRSARMPPAAAK
jgi:hypothetical protein